MTANENQPRVKEDQRLLTRIKLIEESERLEKEKRWAEAAQVLDQLLIMEPDNAEVMHSSGVLWLRAGQLAQARQLLERALAHGNKFAVGDAALACSALNDQEGMRRHVRALLDLCSPIEAAAPAVYQYFLGVQDFHPLMPAMAEELAARFPECLFCRAIHGKHDQAHRTPFVWRQSGVAWIISMPGHEANYGDVWNYPPEPTVDALCTRLFLVTGKAAVVPFTERVGFSMRIAAEGQITPSDKIVIRRGEANQCHQNCARFWSNSKKEYQLWSGYALTEEDLMWRTHSWLVQTDGALVETTTVRAVYFGFAHTPEESESFVKEVMSTCGHDRTWGAVCDTCLAKNIA